MIQTAVKRTRSNAAWITLPTVALALVLIALAVVVASWLRRQQSASDPAAATESASPTFVELARSELVAAAGIEVETVRSQPVASTIECNGSAAFNQNTYVKVPPKAEGVLGQVKVDVGSQVRAGDVLAIVNSQAVGELKALYLKALVHEEHLRWQVDKYKAAGEGVAAKSLFETQHLLDEQLTDTARIVDRLKAYGYSASRIKAIVDTKDMSIELPVVAPRDGLIVSRHAVEGEPVAITDPLFAIADLSTMWLQLKVYENHVPRIHLGQTVTFTPDGLPDRKFAGAVTWINPEVDPLTRTIQLRAEVANPTGELRANMYGKGELTVGQEREQVVVPHTAVQTLKGNHVVFVARPGNRFEVRAVTVGQKNGPMWEVTAGVKLGEKVATTGSFLLKSNLENPDFGKVE